MAALEFLAFTSLWVSATAAALCMAAGRALGVDVPASTLALVAAGTLVVYNVDRLRDTANDRLTSPRRTDFVERWRPALLALTVLAFLMSIALAWSAESRVFVVLALVALTGLFHRRLKRFAWWKPFYVSAAWASVVVGLPAIQAGSVGHLPWVAGVVGVAVLGNVVASNLRDGEAPSVRFGPRTPLRLARGLASLALALAVLAPAPVHPLGFVPLALLAALAPFRPGELYGLVVVDGALLFGALTALTLS